MPEWDPIPDGFYLVGDFAEPAEAFHTALIAAVEKITHIADNDERGLLVGEKPTQRGVIHVPGQSEGLCGTHTRAKCATTTEVYPDSKRTNPADCDRAQAACVTTGIDFVLAHHI
jgi:hypothetical protein